MPRTTSSVVQGKLYERYKYVRKELQKDGLLPRKANRALATDTDQRKYGTTDTDQRKYGTTDLVPSGEDLECVKRIARATVGCGTK